MPSFREAASASRAPAVPASLSTKAERRAGVTPHSLLFPRSNSAPIVARGLERFAASYLGADGESSIGSRERTAFVGRLVTRASQRAGRANH